MKYSLNDYAEMLIDQYADEGEELSKEEAITLARWREKMGDVILKD